MAKKGLREWVKERLGGYWKQAAKEGSYPKYGSQCVALKRFEEKVSEVRPYLQKPQRMSKRRKVPLLSNENRAAGKSGSVNQPDVATFTKRKKAMYGGIDRHDKNGRSV